MEFNENENKELVTDAEKENDSNMIEHNAHHEHHHSCHHSHNHKHKSRKCDSIIKIFLRKNSSAIKGAAIIFLLLVTVILAVVLWENNMEKDGGGEETAHDKNADIGEILFDNDFVYVGVPVLDNEIFLVDKTVVNFISSDGNVPVASIVETTEGKHFDVSYPVKLNFDVSNIPNEYSFEKTSLEISEDVDFEHAIFIELDDEQNASIYNLKTGTEYYYRFSVYLSERNKIDYCGTFRTAETPRILTVDGARNVRDIGGWKTESGKTIKQGLLYRGTELDGAVEYEYKITQKGIDEMLSVLGIKTDMDLRSPEDNVPGSYVLGANVEHHYYNMIMYEAVDSDYGKETVKAVFSDLAKPYKYPVYIHCTYGLDRTGTICCILEALLGLSEENLIKEYELSGFYTEAATKENIMRLLDVLKSYEGENLSQKTENYLLSTGITAEEIASIKEIFLTEG